MRAWGILLVIVLGGILAACSKPPKVTPQEMAALQSTDQQINVSPGAVEHSPYHNYRWLTPQEMIRNRIGYDPSLSEATRWEIRQAVNDFLQQQGFQQQSPVDFVVAFTNSYRDRNREDPDAGFGFGGEDVGVSAGDDVSRSGVTVVDDMELYRTPEERYLILFIDAHTGKLLWRAPGKDVFQSQTQPSDIEAAIYRTLEPMPIPLPEPQ